MIPPILTGMILGFVTGILLMDALYRTQLRKLLRMLQIEHDRLTRLASEITQK